MADELDCNRCTKLMRKYFGKSLAANSSNFLCDLILISMGVKPSLLFDYACDDGEKLARLLEDLKNFTTLFHSLTVIVLGQDVFIADVKRLLLLLKDNLKAKSFTLIDVTGKLENPTFVDEKIEAQICEHFTDLILQVEEKTHKCSYRYDIEIQEDWNICTMFGFVLCYPVIYWFDQKIEYNCLSLVPLALHRATVPASNTCSIVSLRHLIKSRPAYNKGFIAFSCPESLLTLAVVSHIEHWATRLTRIAKTFSMTVNIEKSIVTNKQVIL